MRFKHRSIRPQNTLGTDSYSLIPDSLSTRAAVCQISVMYPPLKPKGLIKGSRSKLEFVARILIDFTGAPLLTSTVSETALLSLLCSMMPSWFTSMIERTLNPRPIENEMAEELQPLQNEGSLAEWSQASNSLEKS